ncbi:MAG: hypothetical protein P9M08_03610 [Candidatus Erginobacter occultus]|nr:hypothetical protein [Candidatus Erginobacter occultus]
MGKSHSPFPNKMICPHCHKNEVTVHYTEIIDGKMVEYHLCEDCAREKGFALTPSDAMAELIGSLAAERHPEGDENPACPHCGLTLKDIRAGGRLGCGECYRAFAANLQPLLKALHRGTRHTGRVPASLGRLRRPPGRRATTSRRRRQRKRTPRRRSPGCGGKYKQPWRPKTTKRRPNFATVSSRFRARKHKTGGPSAAGAVGAPG